MNKPKIRYWLVREDKHLTKHYYKKSIEELMEDLDRSRSAISNRVQKLGLTQYRTDRRAWTTREVKIVEECFPYYGASYVAELIGRSYNSVSSRAHIMGLKRLPYEETYQYMMKYL